MATVIKINYGKDIRRCPVPDSASWADLRARIEALFGLNLSELNVTYQDDDGDVVSITDDFGLKEAIRIAGLTKSTPSASAVLRLTIDKQPTLPSSPRAAPRAAAPAGDELPDVNAVLGAIVRELPMLQPIVTRLKHRVAVARGEAAAGASASTSTSAAEAKASPAPVDRPASAAHQDPQGLNRAEASAATSIPSADASGAHPLHTCDVCEASPIVGVRFHSLVIPNYDLCARCLERESDKQPGGKAAFVASFKPVQPLPGPAVMPWRARGCRGGGGGAGAGGAGLVGARPPGPTGPGPACGRGAEWAERHPACGRGGEWVERNRHAARFIRDVTVFDGTEVAPAARFTKIWRMRNEGEQAWPAGTRLAFCGGDQLDGGVFAQIEGDGHVAPGAEVDVAVDMRAPSTLGRYVGYWRLITPRGKKFGQRIWAQVTVVDPSQPPSVVLGAPPATQVPFAHEHGAHDDQEEDAHGPPRCGAAGRASHGGHDAHVLNELAAVFAAGAKAAEAKAAAATKHAEPKPIAAPPAAPSREPSREPKTPAPEWESWPRGTLMLPSAPQPSAPPLAPILEFPVEVADGRRLAISWRVGAEPAAVARAFAAAHGLPVDDVEEIERFVRKAEALIKLQADLALKTATSQNAKPPTPSAAEPAAAVVAAPVAAKPAAADDASATAQPTERANAAAAAVTEADARALDALRAMGFSQDEALLAAVLANNGGDMLMCIADLTALADWDTMLSDLEAMGFEDDEKNKAALVSSKGDVKSAIRQLVKGAQQPPVAQPPATA